MATPADIAAYNTAVADDQRAVCEALAEKFLNALPSATAKVWHGHPVWFLGSNPVVGYSIKKAGVAILFWSGQSFTHPGLTAMGKFKAAEVIVPDAAAVSTLPFDKWLEEAQAIQWDYANLPKRRALEKLTDF